MNMSEFEANVSVNVDFSELDKLDSRIAKLKSESVDIKIGVDADNIVRDVNKALTGSKSYGVKPIRIEADTSRFDKQISDIDSRIDKLSKLRPGGTGTKRTGFEKMKEDLAEISRLITNVSKLDPVKNSGEIDYLTARLEKLKRSYVGVLSSPGLKLDSSQKNYLNDVLDDIDFKLGHIKARAKDAANMAELKAGIAETTSKYKELLSTTKQIADIKIKMIGLDEGSEKARELSSQLEKAENNAKSLRSVLNGKLSEPQRSGLSAVEQKQKDRVSLASASFVDKTNVAQEKADIADVNAKYKELLNTIKQISSTKVKLASLDDDSAEAAHYNNELKKLIATAQKLRSELSGKLSGTQLSGIKDEARKITTELEKVESKAEDVRNNLKKGIETGFGRGDMESSLRKVSSSYNAIIDKNEDLKVSMKECGTAYRELSAAVKSGDQQRIISANEKWEQSLKEVSTQLDITKAKQKAYADSSKLAFDKVNLSNKMQIWLRDNTAASEELRKKVKELSASLQSLDAQGLKDAEKQFSIYKQDAILSGKSGLNFSDRIKKQAKQYLGYISVASFMMEGMQLAQAMARNVLEVDTAMTGLARVTEMTAAETEDMYGRMIGSAKEYGRTLTDTINATADWVRAGFDENTALGLAEKTAMYQNVSDLDYDTASDNLLTSYNGFKDDFLNSFSGDSVAAVGHVVDVLNELDNKFSVTSAGLGEGLARSASALQIAGNTYEQSAA